MVISVIMTPHGTNEAGERVNWPNKLEYHLSIFSYVLGMISFWRFPYMAFDNGGAFAKSFFDRNLQLRSLSVLLCAPFLYVFLILHVVIGLPFIFLEMAWGQLGNLAPLQIFKLVPAMQGIGVCMLITSCLLLLYFGVASYYFLLYLASSFSSFLPWVSCNNPWNTMLCQNDRKTCEPFKDNVTQVLCNDTGLARPAVEFWGENLVRNASVCSSFDNISAVLIGSTNNGLISPIIILACFVAGRLILSNIALANHIRFTGKVAYLLSTVPVAILMLMLVRCVTLDGSIFGLQYLFLPGDWNMFMSPKVWKDACGQVLLSIMATSGGLITWSSYNRFYNKYYVDAALLFIIVPLLSILAAISVFAVAGHLALVSMVHISDVFWNVESSFVTLIAYSEALSQMWGDRMPWSIAVFSTLFLSSTLAMFPYLECILSCLSDSATIFRRLPFRNLALFIVLVLSVCAYYGIPCFLEGTGLQIIAFFDTFSLPMSLMLLGLLEMLMLCYAFGFRLLQTNAKVMTGCSCFKWRFWTVVWGVLTPLLVAACLAFTVYGIIRDGPSSLGSSHFPEDMTSAWGHIAGGVLVGFMFLVVILVAVIKVIQSPGNCAEKFRIAFSAVPLQISGNGNGNTSHTNGNIFMSNYTSTREPGLEILIDEDIVTSV